MIVERSRDGVSEGAALPSLPTLRKLIPRILRLEGLRPTGLITVVFVGQPQIRKINWNFLRHRGTTDVIAFPFAPLPGSKEKSSFGEIYISVPVAEQNARRFGEPASRELMRLVIHGLLHLAGYTDHTPRSQKKMWARQEFWLNRSRRRAP